MCFTISSFYGGLIKSINQSIKQVIKHNFKKYQIAQFFQNCSCVNREATTYFVGKDDLLACKNQQKKQHKSTV